MGYLAQKQTKISEFDPYWGKVPSVDTNTSIEAAENMESSVGSLRARILEFIKFREGATCEEVEIELKMRHQTASARIRELLLKDQILPTDKPSYNSSGRRARFYIFKSPQ